MSSDQTIDQLVAQFRGLANLDAAASLGRAIQQRGDTPDTVFKTFVIGKLEELGLRAALRATRLGAWGTSLAEFLQEDIAKLAAEADKLAAEADKLAAEAAKLAAEADKLAANQRAAAAEEKGKPFFFFFTVCGDPCARVRHVLQATYF